MSKRPVLSPAAVPVGPWPERSFRLLDESIWAIGHVPDADMLLPADVVLFTDGGLTSDLIGKAQRSHGFHATHARWTHVALYIGDEMLVEAQPGTGVGLRNLYKFDRRETMLVRRCANLSIEDRYRVVIRAMADLGRSYSTGRVLDLVRRAWRGADGNPGVDASAQGVMVCSTLVADAFFTAANVEFKPRDRDIAWPADLSLTKALADVTVGWVKVVGGP